MTKRIGIDIGHGENTFPPAKGVLKNGTGYEEHHFNSAVAVIVDARLKAHGFQTVMAQQPRANDVPLATRSKAYDLANVDFIVSIHANAGVASASGMGIFHWVGNSRTAKFSNNFVKNFKEMTSGVGIWGSGVWVSQKNSWTNFHIVREPKADAVLLELGFMTNANDFEYIFGSKKDKFISEAAEATVKTICEHFGVKYQEPTKDAPVVKPAAPKGDYKIQRGDTFTSIARDKGVDLQELMRVNPTVNPRAMQVGTWIVLPKKKQPVKQPNMTTTSIVTYLNSIGVDSSFGNRSKLAVQYGISGYTGTAAQNTLLLNRMRSNWKPAPKGDQKTDSIVTYLDSIKVNSSFANREKLAKQHGISGYRGTAAQNLLLLKKIRGH